ncbi:MAG: phenylalanine--tRNA ligase subunit alpha [Planctomycetes bacterium]|nr:phenylalanine--tRNA ligase subunit alpha [Planctomycetota bacterium]MCA8937373.1 phenylalanine--tRNA ligase subunit alpha [Planctomycetota bacterium]
MGYDLASITSLLAEGQKAFEGAADAAALEDARREYLGGKGHVKAVLGGIKEVPKEQRGEYGKAANLLNVKLTEAFKAAQARVGTGAATSKPGIDLTKPGQRREVGHAHIITQTIEEIVEIFGRIGFTQVEGPEVEDEFHNFDALNIPGGHPAREEADNFYLQVNGPDWDAKPVPMLLRSQTSTIQIRTMEKQQPPVRVIAPGRVYRPDTVDATHHFMFHQIEGLAIAEDLNFGDLKAVLELFVREYFGADTKMRFRPHYFPFTEPSAEVDIDCQMFKHLKKPWLEILGCGMVDPNVLQTVGYDPEKYTGFAFGMGVERIAMLKHRIGDIRHFTTNDMRFLQQF